jgi:hypothetical protein
MQETMSWCCLSRNPATSHELFVLNDFVANGCKIVEQCHRIMLEALGALNLNMNFLYSILKIVI